MTELRLEALDPGGALQEAVDRVWGGSRADLVRGAAVGGAALLGVLALPAPSSAATTNDVDILNYALTLEYLQASFYTETERIGALRTNAARRAARVLGGVERAHVRALRNVLGRSAVKRPFFNFQGTTEAEQKFLKTAVAFEDLAVAAYKGQAPLIDSKEVLAAAVSIHSVEARHAAWMRHLFGIVPAEHAFDDAASRPAILEIVASTRFIASTPTTTGRGEPPFTG
jgi:ferritin-like protein